MDGPGDQSRLGDHGVDTGDAEPADDGEPEDTGGGIDDGATRPEDEEAPDGAIAVTKVDYTVDRDGDGPHAPTVHVFGRTPEGALRRVDVEDFRPYFYAPEDQVDERDHDAITGVEPGYESIDGRALARVYARIPADVGKIRDDYDHHEADILFPNRFRIDEDVTAGIALDDDALPDGWTVGEDDRAATDGGAAVADEGGDVAPTATVTPDAVAPADVEAPARTMIVDIEVDDRRGFPEDGEEPIVCLTAWDGFEDAYHVFAFDVPASAEGDDFTLHRYDEEEEMLDAFVDYLDDRDPDVLTGWNFDDFDAPYLIDRMERLGMDSGRLSRVGEVWHDGWGGPTIKGRSTFDLLYGYQRMRFTELDSYRLDAIAEEELGDSKVTYTGKIGDLWEDDPERLLEYNKVDVELCVEIDEKVGIVDFFRELSRFVGCSLEDSTTPSDVVDVYVLRKAHGRFVLPSKGGGGGDDYEGGEVFEPITGIRENVMVLDLASLYPMSMVTVNASPETKVGSDYDGATYDVETPEGTVRFRKDREGLTKSIVTELLEERQKKKDLRDAHDMDSDAYEKYDNQQNAIKVVMNSYYGVAGYSRFRLYDREMGRAVTASGRAVIEHTRDAVEDLGYDVIYGDTDSTLVELGPGPSTDEIVEIGLDLEEEVNASYDDFALEEFNAEEHRWEIEFEKLYRRFFQAGRKKRYAGKLVWKEGKEVDDVDITGFEYKRSDVAPITKEVQKAVIERIVEGEPVEDVAAYLRDVVEEFKQGELDIDEVAIPGGIGQKLDEYDTDTAHVKGARYANEHFGTNFTSGSKPKRVYVERVTDEGYPPTDVICFEYPEQVPEGFDVDWDKMLEKTLQSPIERILEALGWSWSEVVSGQRQQGLGSFG